MSRKNKLLALVLLGLVFLVITTAYLRSLSVPVLQPAGVIGQKERNLIYTSLILAVIVVVPVFIMLFTFAWKYREGNTKSKYNPEFVSSRKLEAVWWGIPFLIILILSIITWNSSHDLDPFKPISAYAKPINIQVVALQWKWLFIYPEQNIASVNFVEFPKNTPVNFEVTSDAPMNSFWIPQLGGQIYAMAGMSTHLHLMATKEGDYSGKSANISGKGFSGMTFTARAGSGTDFESWIQSAKQNGSALTLESYTDLSHPSENNPATYYSSTDPNLYNSIVDKYMSPEGQSSHMHDGMGM
jgi:cytochrome o ubiquinol oxidase subunit 2